ncbi:cycloeucalenol cycloisomerase [Selaginella moellendorffii]|nr:cycloeucalenol cycloisomerase [Selaginella moellendorffii]|eukprot:XP_002992397.2 cycloeucalenol cycloisomerase [Selaginella moellendorffii]
MGALKQRRKSDGAADGAAAPVRGLDRKSSGSLWLAPCPSKRWGELFFLAYSPVWIVLCLGIIVPLRIYEHFKELEYFLLGLVVALPCFVVPVFLVGKEDKKLRWYDRYWIKANLWVAIFGYVGNYFWTHYFYTVLGATYTFPSWRLNHVPLVTFFLTHAYFLFYHMVSDFTLRRLRHALKGSNRVFSWGCQALWIFGLSYLTAFMEAVTISNFPYYDMVDRDAFYRIGSLFYAIYFFVSFPMFIRLDENPRSRWTLSQTAIDSLAAAMIVTILLDLWRIGLGAIVKLPGAASYESCVSYGIPWLA